MGYLSYTLGFYNKCPVKSHLSHGAFKITFHCTINLGSTSKRLIKMYNVKGPSKIVAKTTTRRGISQNIDSFRDTSKNMKSLDANDNEIVNGPKPVFHNNSRRILSNHARQQEAITPQHEEIIKYIQDSWSSVNSDMEQASVPSNPNKNRRGNNRSISYYEDQPCPHLQDFKPFDLESWWGKRLYSFITNSVNGKN